MESPPKENLGQLFQRLIPASWRNDCTKFLVHYYSCGIAVETLLSKGYFDSPDKQAETSNSSNALLALAGIDQQETLYSVAFNVAVDDVVRYFCQNFRTRLPKSTYILAISKIADGEEAAAGNQIEKAMGLLAVCTGRGVVLDFVTKLVVDIDTAMVSFPSRILHVPKEFDFVVFELSSAMDELRKRQKFLTAQESDRLDLSLIYVARALAEQNPSLRFLQYWTSLEVLTQGKPEGFSDRLAKHYQIDPRNAGDLRKKLYVDQLVGARVALVHQGKNVKLSSFGERLLQAVIADLAFSVCNVSSRSALDFASHLAAQPIFDELLVGDIKLNIDGFSVRPKSEG